MKDRNLTFPFLMILMSIGALIVISQFDKPMFQDASVDAKFFPRVIAFGIIILSCVLMLQSIIQRTKQTLPPIFSKLSLFGVGFLILYASLIYFIGYLAASLIAFTSYLIFLKIKKPMYYVFSTIFVFFVYYLFSEVFFISLPQGVFF
ncbi:tripartite tricarboxylate transporter TctB family protein [Vibrio sp.]|uniref:tripartite tricarboxylate transporter TctB family protein n=1 Tax=Vibrio sp. TaxID=678 RepID=UPI003AA7B675